MENHPIFGWLYRCNDAALPASFSTNQLEEAGVAWAGRPSLVVAAAPGVVVVAAAVVHL